jgi:hypothetical protein
MDDAPAAIGRGVALTCAGTTQNETVTGFEQVAVPALHTR